MTASEEGKAGKLAALDAACRLAEAAPPLLQPVDVRGWELPKPGKWELEVALPGGTFCGRLLALASLSQRGSGRLLALAAADEPKVGKLSARCG